MLQFNSERFSRPWVGTLFVLLLLAVGIGQWRDVAAETRDIATSAGDYLGQWGEFGSGHGQFGEPRDLAIDSAGNVYVVESGGDRVQKFDAEGNYLGQWGSYGSGPGQLDEPVGIAIDANNDVYVLERANRRIQKFDADGNYLDQWGTAGSGPGQFELPFGLTIDSMGNLYVADTENHRIQKFDRHGNFLFQIGSGSVGGGNGEFNAPQYVAVDAEDNLYVADTFGERIQKFDSSGNYLLQWGTDASSRPTGIAIDPGGYVYVADFHYHDVLRYDANGVRLDGWGGQGTGNGFFVGPAGMAVGQNGSLYVADSQNHRIQVFATTCPDRRLYVDVNGETVWDDLHGTYRLQDALDVARSCRNIEEIWVAKGVYYPDIGANQTVGDNLASFELVNGVAIYGGFAGHETALSERNLTAPGTGSILSGDIDQNDILVAGVTVSAADIVGVNSSSVLLGNETDPTAVLDGFTITAGDSYASGGGLYMDNGQATFRNLLFTGNRGAYGGGLAVINGQPTLTDVSFFGNQAENLGGALLTIDSNLILNTVSFEANEAQEGGALYDSGSNYQVSNSSFVNNTAVFNGGAIQTENSNFTLTDSTVAGNTADWGGGIWAIGSTVSIYRSTLTDNTALTGVGGGIYVSSATAINDGTLADSMTLTSVDNENDVLSTALLVQNSTLSGNRSGWNGGGIGNDSLTAITILNSTITNNTADYDNDGLGDGGGMSAFGSTTVTLSNTILAQNSDGSGESPDCAEISTSGDGGIFSQGYNLIGDTTGCSLSTQASDLLNQNPQLTPLDDHGGATQTHALLPTSPAIDAGDAGACPEMDQRGMVRPHGAGCDIGAYEALAQYALTVSKVGAGSGQVTSLPAGINCGETCTAEFVEDTEVTLTAVADSGSTFTGWSGACSGTGVCLVTLNQAQTATATFVEESTGFTIFLPLVVR